MITARIIQIAAAALVIALAFLYGRCSAEPDIEVRTETMVEYVDRVIERRDTVSVDRPVTRTVFKQQTDTVYIRVPVPVGFEPVGVIHPTPIRIDGRDVTLTYWAPDSLRFIQDTYRVARPALGAWFDTGAEVDILGYTADWRLNIRYHWLRIYGGYQLALQDGLFESGPVYGFRVKLWGRE